MNCEILKKKWPYAAIITAHFIWGINFIAAKLALGEIPPMSLAFLRFALALLLLTPFLWTERAKLKVDKEDLPSLFAAGAMMVTFNIAFFYAGLMRTTVIDAAVLTMVIPIISVLFGWWFLKEKVYVVNLFGIISGLAGAVAVIGLPLLMVGGKVTSSTLLGNFLLIFASISWVFGALLSKKMLKKYSTLTVTAIIFLVGVVTFFIPALTEFFQKPSWPTQVTYIGIISLLFITVASSISAYFLFEWGLGKLGIIKADLFQYIEPVVATSLGVLLLNEHVHFSFIIGAALIALGVYWSTLGKEHHKHHKAHRR